MSGAYPQFKTCYTHEELVEHFGVPIATEKKTTIFRRQGFSQSTVTDKPQDFSGETT